MTQASSSPQTQFKYHEFLAEYISDLKPNGDGQIHHARCPFHEDEKASLSINLESGLWTCHAGCGAGNIKAFQQMIAGGLRDSSRGSVRSGKAKKPAKIVAVYIYQTAEGKYGFEIVRYADKTFKARRMKNLEDWEWNLPEDLRLLYQLPQVLEAVRQGETVFIVEGEKDCLTLEALGLQATTNPFGADKWQDSYSESLRGAKKVVIVPDHDTPGMAHAQKVARALQGVVAEVRLMTFPGVGVAEKHGVDVTDWLNSGHIKEELLGLTEAASVWTASPDAPGGVSPERVGLSLPPEWTVLADPNGKDCLYSGSDRKIKLKFAAEIEDVLMVGERPEGITAGLSFHDGRKLRLVFPASVVSEDNPAESFAALGLRLAPEDSRSLRRLLADTLLMAVAFPQVQGLHRAEWQGDELRLPGDGLVLIPKPGADFLRGYGQTSDVEEAKAREAWAEVLRLAKNHHRLVALMGAAAISPYLERLKQIPFIVQAWGETTRGKTMGAKTAMAAYGDPDELLQTWNATRKSMLERLSITHILPVLFDELGASDFKDEALETIIYSVAAGKGRGRAKAEGGLQAQAAPFNLVVLTTGESRLLASSVLTGTRRRVLEIPAPITPDASSIDDLYRLAEENFGWPFHWLQTQGPNLPAVRADLAALRGPLMKSADLPVLKMLSVLVALTLTGFRELGRWVGIDIPLDTLHVAGQRILEDAERDIREEGLSPADKLLAAVKGAKAARPYAFPRPEDQRDDPHREREGFTFSEGLGILPLALTRIAKDIGLADKTAALRELRERDILLTRSGRLTYEKKISGVVLDLHIFKHTALYKERHDEDS